jgi:hypothetical protein
MSFRNSEYWEDSWRENQEEQVGGRREKETKAERERDRERERQRE